jgi:LuxR family maltose regulon positive regulatory protein
MPGAHGARDSPARSVMPSFRRVSADPVGPVDALSRTELQVLRYLPTNLTRPEIAGKLSVSLNTVSTHIRHIYTKLGVTDRSTAVQRACELRLLSAGRN